MAEAQFPSNSHGSRERQPPVPGPVPAKKVPEKKVTKITQGKVVARKKPLGTRLKDNLIGGNARTVWGTAALAVIVPALRDMFADYARESVDMLIYGESRGRYRAPHYGGNNAWSPYGAQYRPSSTAPPSPGGGRWSSANTQQPQAVAPSPRHGFDEVQFESRGEAEQVLDTLGEIVNNYGSATLADLCDMTGMPNPYTNNKYGWTSLQGAGVHHGRGGVYLLSLPKPEPID